MRMLLAIGLTAFLSGCGISNPILKSEIVSFDDVIESATDKLLVLNILRARDQAPLHFMALPSLRQSITQNNQLSLFEPFGAKNGSTQRNTATLNMSFQVAPTFDLNHIYSKEFVTGMTSPIDPKYVKYWIDRGLDRRLVLLLFFSAAEITKIEGSGESKISTTIRVTNTPKESIDELRVRARSGQDNDCTLKSQFERYLSMMNRLSKFTVETQSAPKLVGCLKYEPGNGAKFLQALAAAEQSKIKYKYDQKNGMYKLYSASDESQLLFCFGKGSGNTLSSSGASKATPEDACYPGPKKAAEDDDCLLTFKDKPKPEEAAPLAIKIKPDPEYCSVFDDYIAYGANENLKIKLQIRSVGEMIHFLGDLLYYQDALKNEPALARLTKEPSGPHRDLHDPVTLGYCAKKVIGARPSAYDEKEKAEDSGGRWDILFNLESGDQPNARFTVPYRDKVYSLGNFRPLPVALPEGTSTCEPDYMDRKDHSLEVLSVVQQLTNLHQSATDVRATPFVQIVP